MAVQDKHTFDEKWIEFDSGHPICPGDSGIELFPMDIYSGIELFPMDIDSRLANQGKIRVSNLKWLLVAQSRDDINTLSEHFVTKTNLGTMIGMTVVRLNIPSKYVRVFLQYESSKEIIVRTGTIQSERSSVSSEFEIESNESSRVNHIRQIGRMAVNNLMALHTDWNFWDQK